ncbi:MAG: fluoride efflux transporter CrcB [Alphaproteobacteria bacterium]
MKTILAIALGGALGSVLRYLTNVGIGTLLPSPFPWGTLTANVLGCFIMGVLIAAFMTLWNPAPEIKAFLTVGFLGGYTTFSAFSADTMTLWTQGDAMTAAAYVTASVVLSIAAVFIGSFIVGKFSV